tara:strand:- start:1785 stop:2396 length:612 start_codon:yes stop_codon:yes gene_type:complete
MKKNIRNYFGFKLESVFLRLRTFLFLFLTPILFFAQINDIIPSLKSKPSLGFKFETKYFLLEDNVSQLRELKPYFEFNNVFRVGVGYCWLKKSKGRLLRFTAFNFFAEYLINFNKYWSAEVPLDFGLGTIKTQDKGFYAFFEPSFIIEYKGFKQFNLGFGTGLRLTAHDKSIYEYGLTVQTLIVRVNLKFVEIYKYFKQLKNT